MNSENPENRSQSDLVPPASDGQDHSEGQLESDKKDPDESTEKEDDYDRIGNVPAADEDDSDPYSHWSTLTPATKPAENNGLSGLCPCSAKRILIVGTVLLILLLIGGLVTATTLLFIERNRPLVSLPHTNKPTPVPPDTPAVNGSVSDLSTSQGSTTPTISVMPTESMVPTMLTVPTMSTVPKSTMELVTSAVTKQTPTTDRVISTSVTTGDETISLTSSTTTVSAPTSTDFSTTTAPPCDNTRSCHSCTSADDRCPRNGSMGNTEEYRMVERCSCSTACFSEVRSTDRNAVHRGCVQGKGSVWQEKSESLTCQKIDTSYVCFCLGHKCNEHDMTPYLSLG